MLLTTGAIGAVLVTPLSVSAGSLNETDNPLWELGAIGVTTYLPDYPGADQNHLNAMVFPWVAYRGKIFRAGDKGMLRARLVRTDKVEFDVSVDGAFPVSSDNNTARKGMSDLDWMGEVGPRLTINILKTKAQNRSARIDLDLPVRAAFSTTFQDFDVQDHGYVFSPALTYKNVNFSGTDLTVKLRAESVFASQDFMDYFYTVPTQYVTSTRAAYQSKSGYLGSRLRTTIEYPWTDRVMTYVQARAESFHGATNADSPLHRSNTGLGVGFGLRYSFYQSDERSK